ncbi:MAG: HEAT repeat domain-containing protein [Phycisphaerales bacterium]|nr:HEAT repeat domain-containing protein [Phycisphaerales bacterium]
MLRNAKAQSCLLRCSSMIVMIGSLYGCGTFDNVPRGTESLLEVIVPQTSPSEAAEMATDEYSAENRYRGTTLLSNADFGGDGVYLELYLDGMSDPDSGVRSASVRALGRHGDPEHVELIISALDDENRIVRVEAARALQRVHSETAIEPLIHVVNEENEKDVDVRAAAADALGQYRESEVVQALISALKDARLVVNNRVQHSLLMLTGQNFGIDRRAWIDWYNDTDDLFEAAQPYTYPVFNRKKRIVEYLPFVPQPPNETTSTPVGMDPIIEDE